MTFKMQFLCLICFYFHFLNIGITWSPNLHRCIPQEVGTACMLHVTKECQQCFTASRFTCNRNILSLQLQTKWKCAQYARIPLAYKISFYLPSCVLWMVIPVYCGWSSLCIVDGHPCVLWMVIPVYCGWSSLCTVESWMVIPVYCGWSSLCTVESWMVIPVYCGWSSLCTVDGHPCVLWMVIPVYIPVYCGWSSLWNRGWSSLCIVDGFRC